MGRLVDHLGKDDHTTWWFYEIRFDFFSVGRCSHTRPWHLFGECLGSLNMGMVLGGLHDHGFTRWMCFDSTSTLIGYGCAMYASKVGPPRKPQKQIPKRPMSKLQGARAFSSEVFLASDSGTTVVGIRAPPLVLSKPIQPFSPAWIFWFFQGRWATKSCAPLGFWRFLAHVFGKSPAAPR